MKRKFTYLLLVIVIIIWGVIFYRLFFLRTKSERVIINLTEQKPHMKITSEPYELIADYRDPFFEQRVVKHVPPILIANHSIEPHLPLKGQVEILPLKFVGLIQNPSTKKQITLINFEGKDFMMGKGDTKNGVTLLEISADSIKVKYQGTTKIFYK